MENLEIKYIVIEIKNSMDGLNSRLDICEEELMNKKSKLKQHNRVRLREIMRWNIWKGDWDF